MAIEVLVVDDDEVDREMLKKAIGSLGTITDVATGSECIRLIEDRPIGLILLDYKLPDYNGLEVISQVMNLRPETAIIVVTGFDSPELEKAVKDAGALDCVPKNQVTVEFMMKTVMDNLLAYRNTMEMRSKKLEEDMAVLDNIIKVTKQKLSAYDKPEES